RIEVVARPPPVRGLTALADAVEARLAGRAPVARARRPVVRRDVLADLELLVADAALARGAGGGRARVRDAEAEPALARLVHRTELAVVAGGALRLRVRDAVSGCARALRAPVHQPLVAVAPVGERAARARARAVALPDLARAHLEGARRAMRLRRRDALRVRAHPARAVVHHHVVARVAFVDRVRNAEPVLTRSRAAGAGEAV